jgi:hypothetical protein
MKSQLSLKTIKEVWCGVAEANAGRMVCGAAAL